MPRIAALATIKAAEGKAKELETAFTEMIAKVQAEQGTLVYALHQKKDEPGTFVFYELYEDDSALQAHSTSEAMKELQGKLAGLLGGRPEIVRLETVANKGLPPEA